MEWNAQPATFRVLYRESGAPDYQVIVPTTSQLSHNISALQPNTLYNIVVEATYNVLQQVNSSVSTAYTTPQGELKGVHATSSIYNYIGGDYLRMSLFVHGFPSHVVLYWANNFSDIKEGILHTMSSA